MSVNPRIEVADRARIVIRNPGAVSVIQAAEINNPSELAYAIRFLTDHYTYKRSKALGEVSQSAASEALIAVGTAAETFSTEVMGMGAPVPTIPPVSPLAEGKVVNPYAYTRD